MEKRIDWIDFAKGFTILFVVLFHSLACATLIDKNDFFVSFFIENSFGMIIGTFIMPVFFAISGYLYKDVNNFKEYLFMIYKKFSSFFILYVIFNIIMVIIDIAKNENIPHYAIVYFPLEYTWFLYAIFVIFIIMGVISILKIHIFIKCILILMLFLLSEMFSYNSVLQLALVFIPCFFTGYLLRRNHNIFILLERRNIRVAISLITFILLFVCHLDVHNANMAFKNIIPKLLFIIILFNCFMSFSKNKFSDFLEYTGRYSLIIYLIHYLFIKIMFPEIYNIIGISDFSIFMAIIFSFIISYGISLFVVYLCKYKAVNYIFFPRQWMDPLVKKTRFGKWIFS